MTEPEGRRPEGEVITNAMYPVRGCYQHTVQEYLFARVIFGEFVCKKQLADFILAIWATMSFFSSFCNGFVGVSM